MYALGIFLKKDTAKFSAGRLISFRPVVSLNLPEDKEFIRVAIDYELYNTMIHDVEELIDENGVVYYIAKRKSGITFSLKNPEKYNTGVIYELTQEYIAQELEVVQRG